MQEGAESEEEGAEAERKGREVPQPQHAWEEETVLAPGRPTDRAQTYWVRTVTLGLSAWAEQQVERACRRQYKSFRSLRNHNCYNNWQAVLQHAPVQSEVVIEGLAGLWMEPETTEPHRRSPEVSIYLPVAHHRGPSESMWEHD